MKKVFLLFTVISLHLISCNSTKKIALAPTSEDQDYYNDPLVKKYEHFVGFIPPSLALEYVKAFRKHKYRGFGKKNLQNAWSTFDRNLITTLTNDDGVDSVCFLFGAYRHKDHVGDSLKHPFVIMLGIKESKDKARGSESNNPARLVVPIYFMPAKICPPPNAGCRIPGEY